MQETCYWPAGPGDLLTNENVPKNDIGSGVMVQIIAHSDQLNAVHWNLPDKSVVPRHNHPNVQFGYVIKGALEVIIEGYGTYLVKAGDSYLIPPNAFHEFHTVGDTQAIDVFNPPRDLSSVGGK